MMTPLKAATWLGVGLGLGLRVRGRVRARVRGLGLGLGLGLGHLLVALVLRLGQCTARL